MISLAPSLFNRLCLFVIILLRQQQLGICITFVPNALSLDCNIQDP